MSVREDVEKEEPLYLAGGDLIMCRNNGKWYRDFSKSQIQLVSNPEISLVDIHPKYMKKKEIRSI